jgi:hypothetical protein
MKACAFVLFWAIFFLGGSAKAEDHLESPVHWALKSTVGVSASLFLNKNEAGYHLLPVADSDVGFAVDLELLKRKLILQGELGLGLQWHFETEGRVRSSLQLPLSLGVLWRVRERVALGLGGVLVFTDNARHPIAGEVAGLAIDIAVSCNNSVGGIIGYASEAHASGQNVQGGAAFLRWAFGPTNLCQKRERH